ncbi:MAG: sugar ABC transporter ATP-binding protein [Eubacteriales bacterium]|nr:sugar ABC transporter ATP-binding protein [Eubacteriales bacterium]
MQEELIRMEHIDKTFPGVKALNDASFQLLSGEVHALVGENGAGKSTLMKVLTGVNRKDKGEIYVRGEEVQINDIRDSQKLGIVMIHQELNLMNHLTVAQNIFIGREATDKSGIFLNDREIEKKSLEIFKKLNLNINPGEKVGRLTVAKQQMVEIAKALSYDSKVLIMDEPTASLTDSEIADLFRVIRMLRDEGKGIIHISHRLEELKQISDRITVMRDGCYVDTANTKECEIDDIISMMVGRVIYVEKPENAMKEDAPVLLEVKNLTSGKNVKDVSFSVREGEILGFSGLVGAGRTETARAIFGADKLDSGEIFVRGKKVNIHEPADAIKHGIAYLSEDRKHFGLTLNMAVDINIALANMKQYTNPAGFIKARSIEANAKDKVEKLDIRTPTIKQLVKNLSGGNQQKVVIAKWLTNDCDVLMFDEPTRGIDVGTKSEIYKLLNLLAQHGKAIIVISSELPEIMRISNRILVMCEGRITGELINNDDLDQNTIMHYATKRDINNP